MGLASEVRVQEEQPTVRSIDSSALLELGMVGISEWGAIGASTLSSSFAEWSEQHGSYTADNIDVVAAVQGFFDNGGTRLRFGRVVHYSSVGDPTTKTSAAATLNLLTATAAATQASVTSSAQPYNLEPGQTLVVSVTGGGDQTITFTATAAARVSANAEPFALANNDTVQISIDGGATQTKTFLTSEFVAIGAATAEEVVASLNAFFASMGMGAVASGTTTVTITSNRRGSGSGVNVVGGTGVGVGKINWTTGNIAGTGNVSNIDAVTAAEVVAAFAALPLAGAAATVVSSAVKLTTAGSGAAVSVQVKAASTAVNVGFDNAVHAGSDGTAVATLQVDGKWDGSYANALKVIVAAASSGEADRFNLSVERSGVVVERFQNLSMLDTDASYVETVINASSGGSMYIEVTDLDATPVDRPANGTSANLAGGSDGLASLADVDYSGGETANGVTGFRVFDTDAIDVLIAPGRATAAVHNAMITYCEVTRTGLVFAVLDPPRSQKAADIVTYVKTTAGLKGLSEFGAIYWPNVKVANPSATLYGSAAAVVVAPSGHIAGLMARNDARKVGGVFEQPAGIDFGVPRNVIGLEMDEVRRKTKRELVFPENINPISQEDGTPIFLDGARCLKTTGNWGSVGQRRGVSFVEKKLIPGLAFMRHRNIKERLYKEGERSIQLFLLELTRNDAFKSKDPKKAFFVDLGAALNTPSVQATKTVFARIGLATSEPAEFIVLLVGPDTRALDEELAALAA